MAWCQWDSIKLLTTSQGWSKKGQARDACVFLFISRTTRSLSIFNLKNHILISDSNYSVRCMSWAIRAINECVFGTYIIDWVRCVLWLGDLRKPSVSGFGFGLYCLEVIWILKLAGKCGGQKWQCNIVMTVEIIHGLGQHLIADHVCAK